ncbi:MAG: LacI family DNA-binding transcriptional regulator [Ardenticatenaceae bacterium]|nr:LacI family DNA-binding transcriptional regulator [Ardenticatenaceae bacterium]
MDGKLTLEKIGALAGVSRATVSRVINNHPNIREEVRQRVLEVIAETGYQPNQAARSLASNRTGLLGLVIPRDIQELFTDLYYPRLIQGVSQACNESGNTLALFIFHTEEEEQQIAAQIMRQGFLDGVIIAGLHFGDPLNQLVLFHKPVLMIGEPLEYPQASFVDADNRLGAYTAVSHLISLGRQRIATITGRLDMTAGQQRRQGYLDALQANNLPIEDQLIAAGEFEQGKAYQATLQLLPHTPDAIFVASDSMALGVLRALADVGLRVPEDVAVVGYDDLAPLDTAVPFISTTLTTIRQPIRRMGMLAVETLLEIIKEPQGPPRRIILPTELIIRQSCGAAY